MSETVVLDPVEVADARVELDITDFIGPAGPDWGDAAIEAAMAEAQRGQIPIAFRIPNRQITIPLLLLDWDDTNFDDLRSAVQAKVARFQDEGGWLKRSIAGDPVYVDIVGATLKLGGGTSQATTSIDPDAVLTLEAIPDFYGDEEEHDLVLGS